MMFGQREGESSARAKIPKIVAIIVSAGRTGTMFFGETLSQVIDGAYSVHEPDSFSGTVPEITAKIRTFGFHHMVLGRMFGRTGIRNLSQRYLAKRLSLETLVAAVSAPRRGFYLSVPSDYVIESYYQWFGILEAVPLTFETYKVVGVVRDPREWVRSMMNYKRHYGSRDWLSRLGIRRLDPKMVGDATHAERWPRMSPFEKNCWEWNATYAAITSFVAGDDHSRTYRFEDLFHSPERLSTCRDLLDFMTRFPSREFPYHLDAAMFSQPRNVSDKAAFPDWRQWSPERAHQLDAICGSLMRDYGYGSEPEWLDLLERRGRSVS